MFDMELIVTKPLKKIEPIKVNIDNELDDWTSVVSIICDVFQTTNSIEFYVSGFGLNKWPLDCRIDLACIVEQLPEIVRKLHNNSYNFKLDFYEQGIERELIFTEQENYINIVCISKTDWKPSINSINVNKETISKIILNLYYNFLQYAKFLCEDLLRHELLRNSELIILQSELNYADNLV